MNNGQQHQASISQLPKELIDWLTKPVTRVLNIESAAGAVLLLFTLIALGMSNSAWCRLEGNRFHYWRSPGNK